MTVKARDFSMAMGQKWKLALDLVNRQTYSYHLNTRLVQYSNGRFLLGSQIVPYSNGGLKTRLKKLVYGLKCLVFKWSAKSPEFSI